MTVKEKDASGYSGTPLAKKLGILPNSEVVLVRAPKEYAIWISPIPTGVVFKKSISASTVIVHVFADRASDLRADLKQLRQSIKSDGVVWVSWPKKASKVPSDITEDTIRKTALPLGFVDVKVCAVNAIWSGIKLVIRKELR